jgi:putative toxin-antitoxin system antitoxin component (TIGR02293 family)
MDAIDYEHVCHERRDSMEWYETANALGGTDVLGEEVVTGRGFVRKVEEGLPRQVITRFKRFSGLSDSDLSAVIPRRTLTSLKRARRLSPEQSDKFARMAGVVAHAQRVFGDRRAALEWLMAPNPALEHELPLRLLRTGSGATLVDSVLTRIEFGVYE